MSLSFGQRLDLIDNVIDNSRKVVKNAFTTEQRVFFDDLAGECEFILNYSDCYDDFVLLDIIGYYHKYRMLKSNFYLIFD